MMDDVLACLEAGLILVLSAVVYVYLVGRVFPYVTMRLTLRMPRYGAYPEGDRGCRRVKFPEGRAVIFEPEPKVRRYLPEYALIKRDGVTLIKCRIHENIRHIRYDVASFDARGKLLDVLGVRERVTEAGYTHTVRLPRDTAYVRVILRKADGMYENRRSVVGYTFTGMAVLCGLTVISTVITGALIYDSLSVLAGILADYVIMPLLPYLLLTLVAGCLNALWIMWTYRIRRVKVLN